MKNISIIIYAKNAVENKVSLKEKIPQIIEDVGFDFSWSSRKVWELNEPVVDMDLKDLEWHFEIPFLDEMGSYDLMPKEVIEQPDKHVKEYERTLNADMKYPIDIMENKGRWLILDGLHRLMKASILRLKKVHVRKIPRNKIPQILK